MISTASWQPLESRFEPLENLTTLSPPPEIRFDFHFPDWLRPRWRQAYTMKQIDSALECGRLPIFSHFTLPTLIRDDFFVVVAVADVIEALLWMQLFREFCNRIGLLYAIIKRNTSIAITLNPQRWQTRAHEFVNSRYEANIISRMLEEGRILIGRTPNLLATN